MYLWYLNDKQGGHELQDLQTGAAITTLPITWNVIDIVRAMADKDKMSSGLRITTKMNYTPC
jgi:hypothetical protein